MDEGERSLTRGNAAILPTTILTQNKWGRLLQKSRPRRDSLLHKNTGRPLQSCCSHHNIISTSRMLP